MGKTPSATSSRRKDGALAAAGVLLLLAAIVWMTWLIRATALPATPAPVAQAPTAAMQSRLEDDAFGVAWQGRAMRRIVQVLQWREVASMPLALDDEVVSDQGDYQLIWSGRQIDSSNFVEPRGHVNPPPPPYRSKSFGTEAAWSDTGTAHWQAVPPDKVALPENLLAVFRPEGAWQVTMEEGALPQPGDLRVRFEVLPELPAPTAADASEAGIAPSEGQADGGAGDFYPIDAALRWISRAAAFVMAVLGAGLGLRGFSRLASPQGAFGGMRAGALLAISAWVAVAAVLVAAAIARVG